MEQAIAQSRSILADARNVAVLSGAGISAESGVPTYRGVGGIWEGFSAAELASAEGFARDPAKVWGWHNQRRMELAAVKFNTGHKALADLEAQVVARGGMFTLATQNIDGLHQAAGSQNVLELHGTILAIRCSQCTDKRHIAFEPVDDEVPRCGGCGAYMRPDIVWFGEQLPSDVWEAAARSAYECDVFMTIGTSAVVYPAAGLIEMAAGTGAKTIEVNLERTAASGLVNISLQGKAGEILPQLADLV